MGLFLIESKIHNYYHKKMKLTLLICLICFILIWGLFHILNSDVAKSMFQRSPIADTESFFHGNKELSKNLNSAKQGDAYAAWTVAMALCMMGTHSHVSFDFEKAMKLAFYWMRYSAENGCPYAMLDLGSVDLEETLSIEEEKSWENKGVNLLMQKEIKNSLDYQYLSAAYRSGNGVGQDLVKAREYFIFFLNSEDLTDEQKAMELSRWDSAVERMQGRNARKTPA